MSTKALIAAPTATGYNARMVQGDGYPDIVGVALLKMVQSFGTNKTIKEMVTKNREWASIGHTEGTRRGYRKVTDFGYYYQESRIAARPFTQEDGQFTDWMYMIMDTGIEVRNLDGMNTMISYDENPKHTRKRLIEMQHSFA